jgi:hypothetical protein
MCASLMRLASKTSLCLIVAHLPTSLPWLQLHTVGKLVIQSTPSTGADIYINGKAAGQTNAAFSVSLGTYSVAVKGGPDKLDCENGAAQVSPGNTVTLTCTPKGWQQ